MLLILIHEKVALKDQELNHLRILLKILKNQENHFQNN